MTIAQNIYQLKTQRPEYFLFSLNYISYVAPVLASVAFLVRTSFELKQRERNVHLKLDRQTQVSHLPEMGVESPGSIHSFRRLVNRR